MILPKEQRRLVVVKWNDAYTHCESPWMTMEELTKDTNGHVVCVTAGWLVREDDDYLTISLTTGDQSKEDNGDVGPAVSIPRAMIVEIRPLEMFS